MPNHVATILQLSGDEGQIKKILEGITYTDKDRTGEEVTIYDFGRLYPMPEELKGTQSPSRIVSEEEYQKAKEAYDNSDKQSWCPGLPLTAKLSAELREKYGADNWYDWCNENWGTKWGTYDVSINDEGNFSYNTAWSPATPMFQKISLDHPDVRFVFEYADEGGGFVCLDVIKNGIVEEHSDFGWESKRGVEIRQKVGYYYEEDDEE